MERIWKDIPDYEGLYQVSDLGEVRSMDRLINGVIVYGKELKQSVGDVGYLQLGLSKDGKVKTNRVHQLVAISFLNHTPNGCVDVVDHIDCDKANNCVNNLRIVPTRINSSRGHVNNTSKYTGVCWHKGNSKWYASIRINNKPKCLGYFIKEEDASEAYQNKLKEITQ